MSSNKVCVALLAVLVATTLVASPAFAARPGDDADDEASKAMSIKGLWIGGGAGAAFISDDDRTEAATYRFSAVLAPHDNLGLEVGYVQIDSGSDSVEPDGATISALSAFGLPFGMTLQGKVGVLLGSSGSDSSGQGSSAGASVTYGAGLGTFLWGDRLWLRADYQHFEAGDENAETVWLTLHYNVGKDISDRRN